MKSFACGDVVPGCTRTFTGPDDGAVLSQVAEHAAADHRLTSVPPELVEQVRAAIVYA
jgi:predicted small metal-binding protein